MIFNNFDYSKILNSEEQKLFFSMLYHDSRNGQIIRIEKDAIKNKVKQFTTFDISQLGCTGTDDNVYMSVNTFRGTKRTSENMFNRTAFFLDLDFHQGMSEVERETALKNTRNVLEKAYAAGELAVPTCIIHSGRGYAIYYILRNSIANTEASRPSLNHFRKVYEKLCVRYQKVLDNASQKLICDVDMKVMDDSRIARMPGTVNQSAHKTAHLISVNRDENKEPLYYEIKDIIAGCGLDMTEAKERYHADIIHIGMQLNPFLATRVHRLEIIRDLRGEACVNDCREMMCFIAYSALTQIYPRQQALDELHSFNDGFTTSLPEAELTHIIEVTDAHVVPEGKYAGEKGYYPYKDYTIVQDLDLTEEEIRVAGFGLSWKRQKEKEERQAKKKSRDEKIIAMITNHPEITYEQIAEEIGVSQRTICRVATENGINRHHSIPMPEASHPVKKSVEEKQAEILQFISNEKNGKNSKKNKNLGSDKNHHESWCVCLQGVFSLLSGLSSAVRWVDQLRKLLSMVLKFEDYGLLDYVCRELYVQMKNKVSSLEFAVSKIINDVVIYVFDYFNEHDSKKFTDLICMMMGLVDEDGVWSLPE